MVRRKHVWILAPVFFLLIYFSVFLHSDRFVDENVAITDGGLFLKSLVSSDPKINTRAGDFNGGTSIGFFVAIPAGLIFTLIPDIAAPRAFMGLWTFVFWLSLCWFFVVASEALDKKFFKSEQHKLGLCFVFLCFVQAVPYSYFNQTNVLSEFPGAAALFLSLVFFIKKKINIGMVLGGFALSLKPNYLVFMPAVFFIGGLLLLDQKKSWKKITIKDLAILALAYFSVPILIQVLKIISYGWEGYLVGWQSFTRWITEGSGSGISTLEPINEWVGYHWRTQAYYILGTFLPLVSVWYLYVIRKQKPRGYWLAMAGLAAVILVGSAQWFFMADYKWWRRALYFVVPGYAIGVWTALAYFRLSIQKKTKKMAPLVYATLIALSLYVQFRQSIYPVFELHKPLTIEQRTAFDWNDVNVGVHK